MIIVLKDANFANANLGQIEIPTANLVSLAILGADTVEGISSSYTCRATYDDNTTREVTSLVSWSVASDTYATISNGVLSIKSAASSPQDVQIIASLNSISTSKTVSVKWTDTIDSEAQTILEAYGNKVLTSEQIHAFADFYVTFKTKSWANKISGMMIPVLCPQTDRLNDLTAVNNTGVMFDIITKSKHTFTSQNSAYAGVHGYAKIGEYGLQKDVTATFGNNFKLGTYISTLVCSSSCLLYGIKRSASSPAITMQTGVVGSAYYSQGKIKLSTIMYNNNNVSNYEANGCLIGANINNGSHIIRVNEETVTNVTYKSENANASITNIQLLGGATLSDGSISFVAFGSGLENEEFLEFMGLVKPLMQALGVIETEQNS